MAKNREASVKFKAETKDFDDAIKRSASNMNVMYSSLRLVDSQMRSNGTSTDQLRNKSQILQQLVAENAAKQQQLNAKLEVARTVYGENSAEVNALAEKLNKAKIQEQNLTSQLDRTESAIKKQESSFESLGRTIGEQESDLSKLKNEYKSVVLEQGESSDAARDLARDIEKLSTELNENRSKMDAAEKAADRLGKEMDDAESSTKRAGDGFTVFRGILSNLATDALRRGADGIRDLSKEVLDLGIDFTHAMSEVEALSGASAEQMEILEAKAREMGATTIYSATDAANALKYMSLAGWDTEQMVGGIAGVLDLAAASGMDLGTACDIVTDYLSAFNMEASQSAELADMMAFAQANANLTTENLAESWKNCAAYLNAGGQSAGDVTTMLSMMANQGFKGSEAGTALSAIMRDMTKSMEDGAIKIGEQTVAVADAEGNYRSMLDIVKDVETATNGMSETQKATALATTFTADSTKGLNLLLNAGADEALAFSDKLSQAGGSASDMADTMNDNLQGDLAEMGSALEETGLQIWEELEEPIRQAVKAFTRDVPKIGQTVKSVLPGAIKTFRNMTTNVDDLIAAGASAVIAMNGMKIAGAGLKVYQEATGWMAAYRAATVAGSTATQAATIATNGLSFAMKANPVGMVITGVAALVSVLSLLDSTTTDLTDDQIAFNDKCQDTTNRINDAHDANEKYRESLEANTAANLAEITNVEDLANSLSNLVDENGYVDEANRTRADYILGQLNDALGTEIQMTDGVIENYQDLQDEIYKTIDAKKADIVMQAQTEAYSDAVAHLGDAWDNYYTKRQEHQGKEEELADLNAELMGIYTDNGVSSLDELLERWSTYGSELDMQTLNDISRVQERIDAKQAEVDETKAALDTAEGDYLAYYDTMATYDAMALAMQEGNTDEVMRLYQEQSDAVSRAMQDQSLSYDEKLRILQTNLDTEQAKLKYFQDQVAAGNSAFTQGMVDDQKAKCDEAQTKIDQFSKETPETLARNLEDGTPRVQTASGGVADAVKGPLDDLPLHSKVIGSESDAKLGEGLDENRSVVQDAAAWAIRYAKIAAQNEVENGGWEYLGDMIASGIASGLTRSQSVIGATAVAAVSDALAAARRKAEVNSPSKLWDRELGMHLGEGTARGIERSTPMVVEAQENQLAAAAKAGIESIPVSNGYAGYAYQGEANYIPVKNQSQDIGFARVCAKLDEVAASVAQMRSDVGGKVVGAIERLDSGLGDKIAYNAPSFPDERQLNRLIKRGVNS